jgi:hypothetical protein
VAKRFEPSQTPAAIDHGVPLFLQQFVETLCLEESSQVRPEIRLAHKTTTPAPKKSGLALKSERCNEPSITRAPRIGCTAEFGRQLIVIVIALFRVTRSG